MQLFSLFFFFISSFFLSGCDSSDDSLFVDESKDVNVLISGVVKDAISRSLLQDVNISINSSSVILTTDSNGAYSTQLLAKKDYNLSFAKETYTPSTYHILTTTDATQTLETLYLSPPSTSNASGYVTSSATSSFLPDVNVSLRFGLNNKTSAIYQSTKTDANGLYNFNGITVSQYTVEISIIDYYVNYQTLTVSTVTTQNDQNYSISPFIAQLDGNESFSGTIRDAVTGVILSDVNMTLRLGSDTTIGTISDTTVNESNGTYIFSNIPPKVYSLEMNKSSYIVGYENVTLFAGTTNANKDYLLVPEFSSDEKMRIVLTWEETPEDLDVILLVTYDSNIKDKIFYDNKIATENAIQYAKLDRDDLNASGPETITVNRFSAGKYICYIQNSSPLIDLNISNASIRVYEPNKLTTIDINTTGSGDFWEVFHIDNGVLSIVNQRKIAAPVLQ